MEEPEAVEVDLDVIDAWDNLAAVASGVGRVLLDPTEATGALDEGGRQVAWVLGSALDRAVGDVMELRRFHG